MRPILSRLSSANSNLKRVLLSLALFPSAFIASPLIADDQNHTDQVDTSTLTGKVMCGYQGWFNCPEDGADLGWTHWGRGSEFRPGKATIDLWPDVTGFDSDELYPTKFRLADGKTAQVFSSHNRKTVQRHFEWMRDYGIDGVFLQRFANGIQGKKTLNHKNVVLENVRTAAKRTGRAYALMYDLSGLKAGTLDSVRKDWLQLRKSLDMTSDKSYLNHDGKPVVAIWGIGFKEDRDYSLAECRDLVKFFKSNGCTVMLGVPTGWRTQDRDAVDDPMLIEIIKLADIISPWTIGRYRTPAQAAKHGKKVWEPDGHWCQENSLDYLPVVFPGFSWHNLYGKKLDEIPRLKGEFLWSQLVAAKKSGCKMIYVAMFDEVDEATAIFKCTNEPPVGEGVAFLTYEGLPSDFYLRLTALGGKLLRGEMPVSDSVPNEMFATSKAAQK